MNAVNTAEKIKNAQSFIRSATAPETTDIAVATNTTWKKKSDSSEWSAPSACEPISAPNEGNQPPSVLSTYMML
ncbi:Uncharacterised protein [Vibrio cholerae]|uniref:Uncharacterized protein n=1 Tax=Vibrio cholerae TaxID=666 RepID=A0A655Z671_VIBCL|nr:Uncharacterised protein [Vibrio cholerae]CSA65212.1 Uncharacterised protein [Vibrio cholerae]CSB28343.1 Uncharacterised protein [Vibrio cholerae]CSB60684.1 Uncharacterised protein [Vibrio cholerae]CSB66867.1 Uncharacterised protein [Vibrio cholerae]